MIQKEMIKIKECNQKYKDNILTLKKIKWMI